MTRTYLLLYATIFLFMLTVLWINKYCLLIDHTSHNWFSIVDIYALILAGVRQLCRLAELCLHLCNVIVLLSGKQTYEWLTMMAAFLVNCGFCYPYCKAVIASEKVRGSHMEGVKWCYSFWATVCKTVRPVLSDHCLSVCLVCLWCWCIVAKRMDGSRWNLAWW